MSKNLYPNFNKIKKSLNNFQTELHLQISPATKLLCSIKKFNCILLFAREEKN